MIKITFLRTFYVLNFSFIGRNKLFVPNQLFLSYQDSDKFFPGLNVFCISLSLVLAKHDRIGSG